MIGLYVSEFVSSQVITESLGKPSIVTDWGRKFTLTRHSAIFDLSAEDFSALVHPSSGGCGDLAMRDAVQRNKAFFMLSLLLAGVLAMVVMLDIQDAVTTQFNFLAVVIGIGLVACAAGCLAAGRWALVPGAAFFGGVAIITLIDWTPVKPFERVFRHIEVGMSQAQVISELDRAFPSHGRFRKPVITPLPAVEPFAPPLPPMLVRQLSIVLDPRDRRYDEETILLDLDEGSVVKKQYQPDAGVGR
jgi:hypothetical protein